MRTIAVMNQKGGCGKTTISINLAAALASLEKQVLLVDLDPQSHATLGLGVRDYDIELTTYELLMDPLTQIIDVQQAITDDLYVVPSSTGLSGVEQELANQMGREERVANKLSQLGDNAFDFVIIDCPPSVGLLTFNALIAAREVIIPVDASYFSLQGLGKLRETVEVIEEEVKRKFRVHVVANNLETRTLFSKELLGEIEKFHAGNLAETFISHTVRLKEAAAAGVSILDLDRRSKAARQFLLLGQEIIAKAPKIVTDNIEHWAEKLHGPRKVSGGVLFRLDFPQAREVAVTGEFNNWSTEGIPMQKDTKDGFWKAVLDIEPGEYEYRFIVDGIWIRDPNNRDFVRNEFGQENSLLVV